MWRNVLTARSGVRAPSYICRTVPIVSCEEPAIPSAASTVVQAPARHAAASQPARAGDFNNKTFSPEISGADHINASR